MTLNQIKAAIENGEQVFCGNLNYPVIKDCKGQYLITCKTTNYCIMLTWMDGVTLNDKEENFFILN